MHEGVLRPPPLQQHSRHQQRRRASLRVLPLLPLRPCSQGEPAYAIVLAGGYKDDADGGRVFWYTGAGGQESKAQVRARCGTQRTGCQCNAVQSMQLGRRARPAAAPTNTAALPTLLQCNAQVRDQSLSHPDNAAMVKNVEQSTPVRVFRGQVRRRARPRSGASAWGTSVCLALPASSSG